VEIGPLCANLDIYLHVDAAYAGNTLILNAIIKIKIITGYLKKKVVV
jgi:hypothetical protein